MRTFKQVSALAVVVFALGAFGVANASAATKFTASTTGFLAGKALETQKFKTGAGTIECAQADISGSIFATEMTELEAAVTYTECKAFGFLADIAFGPQYQFRANGDLFLQSSFTFTVTGGIFGECTIRVPVAQLLHTMSYTNNSGKLKITPFVPFIEYTSSGGICGSAGTHNDMTYTGAIEVEEIGGALAVD